ncbi:DUF2946 family protein [Aromatoleum sp.]|uniref:DUF2946 family protein n=1 Tax=Aromatoleum sp. TaxID=2307007 RepID=UPI002FC63F18
MQPPDLSTAAKWPGVPASYGWLSLDRRGNWRLQGKPVTHAGLVAFLNRNYGSDSSGRWFVQNGPQRVFTTLDYTPFVLRLEVDGSVTVHTGTDAGAVESVHLDDEGSVLLKTAQGVGLLDDRDLANFIASCCRDDRTPANDVDFFDVMSGAFLGLFWRGRRVQPIGRDEVPAHFGFDPNPSP